MQRSVRVGGYELPTWFTRFNVLMVVRVPSAAFQNWKAGWGVRSFHNTSVNAYTVVLLVVPGCVQYMSYPVMARYCKVLQYNCTPNPVKSFQPVFTVHTVVSMRTYSTAACTTGRRGFFSFLVILLSGI